MSLSPSLMPVTCALPPTASASPLSLSLLHCSGCCCCHHHLRSVDDHPPPSPAGDDDGGHRRDDVGSRARLHRFIHSARRRRSRRGRCCCSPADPSFRPAAETWGRCGVAWGDPWVWHGGWVQVVGVGSQHSTLAITWCCRKNQRRQLSAVHHHRCSTLLGERGGPIEGRDEDRLGAYTRRVSERERERKATRASGQSEKRRSIPCSGEGSSSSGSRD